MSRKHLGRYVQEFAACRRVVVQVDASPLSILCFRKPYRLASKSWIIGIAKYPTMLFLSQSTVIHAPPSGRAPESASGIARVNVRTC